MSFPDVYVDTPFHDPNWVLVRCRKNKRAFLWTYEYQGQMRINVKADPEWIDFWRKAYEAVIPGYHQNKKHWNTVILDGSVPDGPGAKSAKAAPMVCPSPSSFSPKPAPAARR